MSQNTFFHRRGGFSTSRRHKMNQLETGRNLDWLLPMHFIGLLQQLQFVEPLVYATSVLEPGSKTLYMSVDLIGLEELGD
jgi:hypothetical protein